jgi:hypothetical protein
MNIRVIDRNPISHNVSAETITAVQVEITPLCDYFVIANRGRSPAHHRERVPAESISRVYIKFIR